MPLQQGAAHGKRAALRQAAASPSFQTLSDLYRKVGATSNAGFPAGFRHAGVLEPRRRVAPSPSVREPSAPSAVRFPGQPGLQSLSTPWPWARTRYAASARLRPALEILW